MVSNILIGLSTFIAGFMFGGMGGMLMVASAITKVDRMYKDQTGNSFVEWIFDAQTELRKHRIEELYAAE